MDSGNHNHHYSARIALGRRLKNWRLKENLNLALAADRLGVSTAAWGHWETGEHLPSGDMLLAIEDLTGLPLYVLFCPHLDTCPQANNGQMPVPGHPCCQRGIPSAGMDCGT